MDIYFENLIYKKDGKIDDKSPVRWSEPLTGKTYYGDFKSFSIKWFEFSTKEKSRTRFFLAAKQLMSVIKTNEFELKTNSPIRILDFFPLLLKLISQKKPTFFFDCSGNTLYNFHKVLTDLDIKKPKIYSLGLGISWEKNSLTIYPSRSLITIRYGFSDFVSFPIDIDKQNSDIENQLNILIDSLGDFKKINIIKNKDHEKIIANNLLKYKKEFKPLNLDVFLPELIIEKDNLSLKKKISRLFGFFSNEFIYLLKLPNVASFFTPIGISVVGLLIFFSHEVYVNQQSSRLEPNHLTQPLLNKGSLMFLSSFIDQSESLTSTKIKSIELKVKQDAQNMLGSLKVALNGLSFADPNVWLEGISELGKDAKFNKKNSFFSFSVRYQKGKINQIVNQRKILSLLQDSLRSTGMPNQSLVKVLTTTQSEKKVIVSFENESITKIRNFLLSFQKKQSSWDWVLLRFSMVEDNLTSFYGIIEFLEEENSSQVQR